MEVKQKVEIRAWPSCCPFDRSGSMACPRREVTKLDLATEAAHLVVACSTSATMSA